MNPLPPNDPWLDCSTRANYVQLHKELLPTTWAQPWSRCTTLQVHWSATSLTLALAASSHQVSPSFPKQKTNPCPPPRHQQNVRTWLKFLLKAIPPVHHNLILTALLPGFESGSSASLPGTRYPVVQHPGNEQFVVCVSHPDSLQPNPCCLLWTALNIPAT